MTIIVFFDLGDNYYGLLPFIGFRAKISQNLELKAKIGTAVLTDSSEDGEFSGAQYNTQLLYHINDKHGVQLQYDRVDFNFRDEDIASFNKQTVGLGYRYSW